MRILQHSVLLLIFFCVSAGIAAGQSEKPEVREYVVVPLDATMLVVASQPDSALVIDDPKLLISVKGDHPPIYRYALRNRGTKAIRYFTIAALTSRGTGGTLADGHTNGKLLIPGQSRSSEDSVDQFKIVTLTDSMRERLGFNGRMHGVVVLIVQRIVFEDGSIYDQARVSKVLMDYFIEGK